MIGGAEVRLGECGVKKGEWKWETKVTVEMSEGRKETKVRENQRSGAVGPLPVRSLIWSSWAGRDVRFRCAGRCRGKVVRQVHQEHHKYLLIIDACWLRVVASR